ncbi:MAG: TM2 domain-containing protein [Bacteroidales bacterium]|nr:TM2 domain-containing protein [Bacteroidales bacterium]
MFCKNCGNQVTPGVEICEICGLKVTEGTNYCQNCGHICIPGDIKCFNCGSELVTPPIITTEPPPIPEPKTKAQEKNTENNMSLGPKLLATGQCYCRNCGLVIPEDVARCPYCDAQKGSGFNYCQSCGSGTIEADKTCSVCAAVLTRVSNRNSVPNYIPSQPPARPNSTNKTNYNPSSGNTYNVNIQNNNYHNSEEKSERSRDVALLLAILPALFGICGIHRFYTGHIVSGVIQLLTGGLCWIWQIIDIITIISGSYRDKDEKKLS